MEASERKVKAGKLLIWIAIGAVASAVAWWPIVGAVEGMFWGRTYDAKGSDDLAIDEMLAAHPELQYGVRGGMRDIPPLANRYCLNELERPWITNSESAFAKEAMWLSTALYHERNRRDEGRAYVAAVASLRTLPNPTIGALQGCINGSLLGRVCDAYVVRRVRVALAAKQQDLRSALAADEFKAQKAACHALDGVAKEALIAAPRAGPAK